MALYIYFLVKDVIPDPQSSGVRQLRCVNMPITDKCTMAASMPQTIC